MKVSLPSRIPSKNSRDFPLRNLENLLPFFNKVISTARYYYAPCGFYKLVIQARPFPKVVIPLIFFLIKIDYLIISNTTVEKLKSFTRIYHKKNIREINPDTIKKSNFQTMEFYTIFWWNLWHTIWHKNRVIPLFIRLSAIAETASSP